MLMLHQPVCDQKREGDTSALAMCSHEALSFMHPLIQFSLQPWEAGIIISFYRFQSEPLIGPFKRAPSVTFLVSSHVKSFVPAAQSKTLESSLTLRTLSLTLHI